MFLDVSLVCAGLSNKIVETKVLSLNGNQPIDLYNYRRNLHGNLTNGFSKAFTCIK